MHDNQYVELRQKLRRFVADRNWTRFHNPKNLAMALSVETAELLEHFQWLTPEEAASLSDARLAQVRHEMGDVFIYLTHLADALGIDLLQAALDKLALSESKYPVDAARKMAENGPDAWLKDHGV